MKPANWNSLTPEEQKAMATALLGSMRGIYLMSQALSIAITAMNTVDRQRREVSNIQDMEMLTVLFPLFNDVTEAAGRPRTGEDQ